MQIFEKSPNLVVLDKAINCFVFLLVSIFFIAQPWHKHLVSNVVIALLLLSFVLLSLRYRVKFESRYTYIIGLSILVFFSVFLSWYLSPFPDVSSKRMEPYARFLIFGLIVYSVLSSKFTKEQFVIAVVLGCLSFGIYGFQSRYGGFTGRLYGVENAVNFGNAAFLLSMLAFSLLFSMKGKYRCVFLLTAGIVAFWVSIESGTRGSYLGLPLLLILFGYKISQQYGKRLVVISALAMLITLGAVTNFEKVTHSINSVVSYFSDNKRATSEGQRLELWRFSVCVAEQYPVLGTGPGTLKQAQLSEDFAQCHFEVTSPKGYFHQAHSVYFQTLATLGFVGLFLMMGFFFLLLYVGMTTKSRIGFSLVVTLITLLGYGLTVDLFFFSMIADRHIILIAILLALIIKDEGGIVKEQIPRVQ